MNSPRGSSNLSKLLARYTPDSRRWRRRIAGLTAIAAPLALYAIVAIISGVKSGITFNLLVLIFGVLTLVLPAVSAAALLAPTSGLSQTDASRESAVETLKRRYATGEIDQEEFDRRLDDLVGIASDGSDQSSSGSVSSYTTDDVELDRTGQ